MYAYWNQHEIQTLYHAYQQRTSPKKIAKILGRSVSATYKALTRFGIKSGHYCPLSSPKSQTNLPQESSSNHLINNIIIKKNPLPRENWLKPNDLVLALAMYGIHVTVAPENKFYSSGPLYHLNGQYVTPSQLLILTNKLRFYRNLPPFFIEGITDVC